MKNVRLRRFLTVVSLCASAALLGVAAYAEMPAADSQDVSGVAHQWVAERMGYAPFTEPSDAERAALKSAQAALVRPPVGLIRKADHGYPDAQALVLLARSLAGSEPAIVGHELVVWSGDKAARIYVGDGGAARLLEAGDIKTLVATHSIGATDKGDRDAVELAKQAVALAKGIDSRVPPVEGALVTAHAVGFADDDGSHVVVRVDPNGVGTLPGW